MRSVVAVAAAAAVAAGWAAGAGGASGTAPRVQVFLTKGEHLAAVTRPGSTTPLRAALRALVAGPTAAERARELGTSVPARTVLRGVSLRGGVAVVDLSRAFASGGGSLSMQARVAQVVYTATQFRTVRGVRFALAGRVVDVLGGEGLIVDRPLTRTDVALRP